MCDLTPADCPERVEEDPREAVADGGRVLRGGLGWVAAEGSESDTELLLPVV